MDSHNFTVKVVNLHKCLVRGKIVCHFIEKLSRLALSVYVPQEMHSFPTFQEEHSPAGKDSCRLNTKLTFVEDTGSSIASYQKWEYKPLSTLSSVSSLGRESC